MAIMIEVGFNIVNDGQGGPINYATSAPSAPSSYKFGVRAFGSESSLEERNLDASVRPDLDADVTWAPRPPLGVRALALTGGRVRVEWNSPTADRRRKPTGFNVYAQAVALTNYAVSTDGASYTFGVRPFNEVGEEHNSSFARAGDDAPPPHPLDSLQATRLETRPRSSPSPSTTPFNTRMKGQAAMFKSITGSGFRIIPRRGRLGGGLPQAPAAGWSWPDLMRLLTTVLGLAKELLSLWNNGPGRHAP